MMMTTTNHLVHIFDRMPKKLENVCDDERRPRNVENVGKDDDDDNVDKDDYCGQFIFGG